MTTQDHERLQEARHDLVLSEVEVLLLADPGSWLEEDPSEPDPVWREQWSEQLATDRPIDLVVATPTTPMESLRRVRADLPGADILMATSFDDTRGDEFFGDQAIFFIPPPTTVGQLRTCVHEVLSFRDACRRSEEAGEEVPELLEKEPVSGWYELTGPTHPIFLRRFRTWLELLEGVSLDPNEVRRLTHAVREVGWNAIEWGNRFELQRRLKFSFMKLDDRLLFRIEDEGGGKDWAGEGGSSLDPVEEQKRRASAGLRYGGLGLRLVQKIMDQIEVNSNGNIVVMEKVFGPRESGEAS